MATTYSQQPDHPGDAYELRWAPCPHCGGTLDWSVEAKRETIALDRGRIGIGAVFRYDVLVACRRCSIEVSVYGRSGDEAMRDALDALGSRAPVPRP